MVDLHVHSNKSDGSFTPQELVDYALEKGLSAFALTDHDTTEGIDEALACAKDKPIEIIPGIEFSTAYLISSRDNGRSVEKDIHIVGLYIDHHAPAFQKQIHSFVDSRVVRNRKMCENLRNAGIDITYEKLLAAFPGAVITRAHYASYLLQNGYVKSMREAFDRFLGDRTPYFVPREKVTPVQAVKLILACGGFPVLAHPTLYHLSAALLDRLTAELKEAGLMGVECIYSTYTAAETREISRLAAKHGLLPSGGSDFHGSNKPKLDLGCGYGKLYVPDAILTDIKKALGKAI